MPVTLPGSRSIAGIEALRKFLSAWSLPSDRGCGERSQRVNHIG